MSGSTLIEVFPIRHPGGNHWTGELHSVPGMSNGRRIVVRDPERPEPPLLDTGALSSYASARVQMDDWLIIEARRLGVEVLEAEW